MKLTKRVLHNQARPVDFRNKFYNERLAMEMIAFMDQAHGIGLAAPQIGIARRLFVMRVNGQVRMCFNPEVLHSSDVSVDFNEGCLSFPGDQCIIKRPENVHVRYQNLQAEWIEENLVGLEARCFQHELDHLDGVTMHDRYKEQHAE